ncbi:hypothetical protein MRY87_08145 [bacterium]|nr:hypothetical protein [bacterium]
MMRFQLCSRLILSVLLLTPLGCAREVTPVTYTELFREHTTSRWKLLSPENDELPEESNSPDILVRRQNDGRNLFTIGLHSCRELLTEEGGRFSRSWQRNSSRQLLHGFQEVELFEEWPVKEGNLSVSLANASLSHQPLSLILFAALHEGCVQEQIFWSSRREEMRTEERKQVATELLQELNTIPPWNAAPWREILEHSTSSRDGSES